MQPTFLRLSFVCLSIALFSLIAPPAPWLSQELAPYAYWLGGGVGFLFGGALILLERLVRTIPLRILNTLTFGLFCGFFLSQGLLIVYRQFLALENVSLSPLVDSLISLSILLSSLYVSLAITLYGSGKVALAIPFVNLTSQQGTTPLFVLDKSVLTDPRLADFALSGILNNIAVVPRFLIRELTHQMEHGSEEERNEARRAMEELKQLENDERLSLRISETHFPEVNESATKVLLLAQSLHASILTTEITPLYHVAIDEEVPIINLNDLARALKPPQQAGEYINIKVQRYGKEARQGIGYLDDGTMVVVNGGAEFIGETIRAQVLSAKHSSAGRIIFCNAITSDKVEYALST